MALVTDLPEDIPTTVTEPPEDLEADPTRNREPGTGERAEIYLSGAHVCTLDDAPGNRQRITLMCEVEVTEEAVRANGDDDVPIRKVRRIGDMYLPGTKRPPTNEEIKAMADAAKAKVAAEKAAQEEAERAEREHNEPPMFDEDGDPIGDAKPDTEPAGDVEDQGDAGDQPADPDPSVVQFSDRKKKT
ncbi:hypothetical protein KDW75_gp47 [Mycobacterium phage Mercurio]|uniref:Uncharacterized protein n=1 Tax=Mycobacterium phage Mercurio TaxID=2575612 RepID=A0A5J6T6I1_9CAUD|nr:hypothetical protein KDW75_gp47 [Mycobacterium phage Mercurio]QFG06049.1 hypothetical protein PBI_MERCURIO_47 [Mycobacterium phage Mercurio]